MAHAMWFPRLLGVATAAYGAAVAASPALLARPCGLAEKDGSLSDKVTVLCRGFGARDVVSGVAMVMASSAPAMRQAIAVRAASDLADAAVFGALLPDPRARGKAAGVAAAWGTLCAVSAVATRDR